MSMKTTFLRSSCRFVCSGSGRWRVKERIQDDEHRVVNRPKSAGAGVLTAEAFYLRFPTPGRYYDWLAEEVGLAHFFSWGQ